jgi:hypothetical protein
MSGAVNIASGQDFRFFTPFGMTVLAVQGGISLNAIALVR